MTPHVHPAYIDNEYRLDPERADRDFGCYRPRPWLEGRAEKFIEVVVILDDAKVRALLRGDVAGALDTLQCASDLAHRDAQHDLRNQLRVQPPGTVGVIDNRERANDT